MFTRLLTSLTIFTASLFLFATSSFALTLDTIGSSATTSGNPGSDWYFTAENPVLGGTAAASSTVTIDVDSQASTTVADTSGLWSYSPTTLTTGDHVVTITGDGQTITFTLHIGQSVPGTGSVSTSSATPQTLPVSGALENTLILLGGGLLLILAGWKLKSPQT